MPSFLNVQLAPVQPDLFLSQLPVHLSRFIKESAEIIKQYNQSLNTMDYTFKFKNLDLNIVLSKSDESLKILIQVGNEDLKKV